MAETKTTKTTKTATTKKVASTKTTTKTTTKVENKQPKKVAEVKVEKVAEVKEVKPATKQIKVTYTKSVIGYNKNQAKVLTSLGLKKLNSSHVLPDNACVRGMIHKVAHLVKVEELN